MNAEQQKALDKIKKCLKLAGSSNANEAAAAMRQAQLLMEKYNVDMDDMAASEVTPTVLNARFKTNPTRWESALAQICADAFGCRVVLFTWGRKINAQWSFIGCGSASELSGYTFQVLLRQIKKDRAAYIKTKLSRCGPTSKTARCDTFCLAWVWGVREKVQDMAPNEKNANAIAAYIAKHHPSLSTSKPRTNGGNSTSDQRHKDAEAGERAGRNANLNRGVGNDAGAAALEHHA